MKNNILTVTAMTLVTGGLLFFASYTNIGFAQTRYEPQTGVDTKANVNAGFIPSVKSQVVATHTIEYVEKPVTEVKYVERVKQVPVELRNFNDLDELKLWLENKRGITTIKFQPPDATVDCDDFAHELQMKALTDGYVMSFQIIEPDKYNNFFANSQLPPDTLHAINLVLIGNSAYYIEPQTGEIVLAAHID